MRLSTTLFCILMFQLCIAQDSLEINIDLGGNNSNLPWNNLSNSANGTINNLIDQFGNATDISIEVYDSFNGVNQTGTTAADPNLNIPETASSDSFFGNSEEFAGNIETTGGVLISGLDVSKRYDLSLFASRLATNNRETQYNIASSVNDTLYLNASDNADNLVELQSLTPRADGTIQVECTTGPNNDSDFGFFYLGVVRLKYESIIIPQDPMLVLTHPNGGEYWQAGKSPEIRWHSQAIQNVLLEFSINGGNNWETIGNTSALTQSFEWQVPNLPTDDCLIRISSDSLTDQSQEVFKIPSEDSLNCHVVILGSSTAAGTGPSTLDSAWVWMFRDTLFQRDTRFQVTNLAQGGFTTYNILPSGTAIPTGVNQTVDENRNITQALLLEPDAIVINLPSNDAANSYSVEDQLANYDLILDPAEAAELPFWVCTPQPRNGFNLAQVEIQEEMRDSTNARFGEFALDFWNTLADSDGFINPLYNSGDGVHLNNAGHKLLLQRVLEKEINGFLLDDKNLSSTNSLESPIEQIQIFPNPAFGETNIQLAPPFDVSLYNKEGKLLKSVQDHSRKNLQLNHQGLIYLLIEKDNKRYGAWILNR